MSSMYLKYKYFLTVTLHQYNKSIYLKKKKDPKLLNDRLLPILCFVTRHHLQQSLKRLRKQERCSTPKRQHDIAMHLLTWFVFFVFQLSRIWLLECFGFKSKDHSVYDILVLRYGSCPSSVSMGLFYKPPSEFY